MEAHGENRRYFDNAATSYPKPPTVTTAIVDYLANIHGSAGRGAYAEAVASRRIVEDCRAACRALFGCGSDHQVIFTLNGTDGLNLAIKGSVRPGDHVVTTVMDHNSVLRPLHALHRNAGVTFTAVPVDPETTRLDPGALAAAIRDQTTLVVLNHASNVTGVLQPLADVVEVCRARRVALLVDAAQSAGHAPIDLSALPIDMLACPGHKGLLGPLGTGVLVLRPEAAERLHTVREGGTGSQSESPIQPEFAPDKFEAGSHNAVGIAGLLAALRWIRARGIGALRAHERHLCERMIDRLTALEGVRWFGPRDPEQRVGVFSVRVDGWAPEELSVLLEQRFGLLTRSGLHCAPWAHRAIGTHADGGTTRLSLGPFLESQDVDAAADALAELVRTPQLA